MKKKIQKYCLLDNSVVMRLV